MFAFIIPVIDQILKFWVRNNVKELNVFDAGIPFLKLTYIKNFGAALGTFSGGKYIFICVTIVVILVILYSLFIKKIQNRNFVLSSSFIIGGGAGNLIDRIFFGYVTDYLKVSFFPPVCNLSDYFICIGIILMMFYVLKNDKNS